MARILLIENSPSDLAVSTQWLEKAGHQVLCADTAKDGRALVRGQAPSLVPTDGGLSRPTSGAAWRTSRRCPRAFDDGAWRGIGCRVGKRHLLADFRDAMEFVRMPPVTPVPGAQPWLPITRQSGGDMAPTIDAPCGQRSFAEARALAPGDLAPGRYAPVIERTFRDDAPDGSVRSRSLSSRTPEFRHAAA